MSSFLLFSKLFIGALSFAAIDLDSVGWVEALFANPGEPLGRVEEIDAEQGGGALGEDSVAQTDH